jgi:hypothetical protein
MNFMLFMVQFPVFRTCEMPDIAVYYTLYRRRKPQNLIKTLSY